MKARPRRAARALIEISQVSGRWLTRVVKVRIAPPAIAGAMKWVHVCPRRWPGPKQTGIQARQWRSLSFLVMDWYRVRSVVWR